MGIAKYRGKKSANEPYIYGHLWENKVSTYIIDEERVHIPVSPKTVGQYTGAKTKENIELYEGDEIEFTIPDESFWGKYANTRKIGTIRYEEDYCGFIVEWEYSKNQHHVLLNCDIAYDAIILNNENGILDKIDISDLSYSGIVKIVDTDVTIGKEMLIALYNEFIFLENQKSYIEACLRNNKCNINAIKNGMEYLFKHMKWELPLTILDGERLIKIISIDEIEESKYI